MEGQEVGNRGIGVDGFVIFIVVIDGAKLEASLQQLVVTAMIANETTAVLLVMVDVLFANRFLVAGNSCSVQYYFRTL